MENIHSNIWAKMTVYRDNLSDYSKRELSLDIRYEADVTYFDELVHVWSLKTSVKLNLKRKYGKYSR